MNKEQHEEMIEMARDELAARIEDYVAYQKGQTPSDEIKMVSTTLPNTPGLEDIIELSHENPIENAGLNKFGSKGMAEWPPSLFFDEHCATFNDHGPALPLVSVG